MNKFYSDAIEKVLRDHPDGLTAGRIIIEAKQPGKEVAKALNQMVEDRLIDCDEATGIYTWGEPRSVKEDPTPNANPHPEECPGHVGTPITKSMLKVKKSFNGRVPCPYCDHSAPNKDAMATHISTKHRAEHAKAKGSKRKEKVRPGVMSKAVEKDYSKLSDVAKADVERILDAKSNASVDVPVEKPLLTCGFCGFTTYTPKLMSNHICKPVEEKIFIAVDPEPPTYDYSLGCFGNADVPPLKPCAECTVEGECTQAHLRNANAPHLMDDPLDAIYEIVARAREAAKSGWGTTADITINVSPGGEEVDLFSMSMSRGKVSQ